MERKVKRTKKELIDNIRKALQFGAKTLHETGKVSIRNVQDKYGVKNYEFNHANLVDLIHTSFSDAIAMEMAEEIYNKRKEMLHNGPKVLYWNRQRTTAQIKKAIFDGIMKGANIMEKTGDCPVTSILKEFRIATYCITKKDIIDVVASGMDLAVAECIVEKRYEAARERDHKKQHKSTLPQSTTTPEPIEAPSRPVIIMKHEEPATKVVPLKKEEPVATPAASSMSLAVIFKTVSDSDLVCELRSRGYEVTASKYVVL